MTINLSRIKPLNPCKDRLDNYVKYYKDKDFSPRQFLGLKNITHKDKLWVAFRLMSKDQVVKAAATIAKSVLHIYEAKYPNDNRVRVCIEATLAGTVTREQREAANAAAYDANAAYDAATNANAAAAYDAYAAATNAAYAAAAANAATNAANAAAYAAYAAAYAAYAATNAAAYAKTPREVVEKQQRTIILKFWK